MHRQESNDYYGVKADFPQATAPSGPGVTVHQPRAIGHHSATPSHGAAPPPYGFQSDSHATEFQQGLSYRQPPAAAPVTCQPSPVVINPVTLNTVHSTPHHHHAASPPMIMHYGPHSQHVICPYCHAYGSTTVESKATSKTHLWALLLCCCCGEFCCCFLPYCINSCQSQHHYCSNCKAFLGQHLN